MLLAVVAIGCSRSSLEVPGSVGSIDGRPVAAAPSASCPDGTSACAEGCVDALVDPLHCGGCDRPCPASRPLCLAGECVEFCWADDTLCGSTCEHTGTSPSHCGSCDNICPGGDHGRPVCLAGECGLACDLPFAECDGDPDTGCETDLDVTPRHCGACGAGCDALGAPRVADYACSGGSCVVAACDPDALDCDGAIDNGCERDQGPAACRHYGWDRLYPSVADVAVLPGGDAVVVGTFSRTYDFGGGSRPALGSARGFVLRHSADGAYRWDALAETEGAGHAWARAVAVRADGQILVVGEFSRQVVLDGVVRTASGGRDAYIVSYDPDGSFAWARVFGGPWDDHATGIAISPAGEVIVVGSFMAPIDFGGGERPNAGLLDIFVAAYADDDGSYRWDRTFGGEWVDEPSAVAVDADSNVVLTGRSLNVDFGGGPVSAGVYDAFVLRLGREGAYLWDRVWGGPAFDHGLGVAVDTNRHVYVTGRFGIGTGPFGATDAFLVSFDSDGAYRWDRTFGDSGRDVAVDAAGHVLVAGDFVSTDFGGGSRGGRSTSAFVASYRADGSYRWDDTAAPTSGLSVATAVASAPSGDVVFGGWFTGTADFGGGERSAGTLGSFLVRLRCGCP